MKKRSFNIRHLSAALATTLLLAACTNDEWEKHYNAGDLTLADMTLTEYIRQEPELSTFYQLMERSGYDKILNSPITYTVWAPINEALSEFDPATTDSARAKEIVENHISRFSYTTSGLTSVKIFLLSKKLTVFQSENDHFLFGGNALVDQNIATKNGILHTLNGYAAYNPNLWEYLDRIDDIDSVRDYFYRQIVTDDFGEVTNLLYKYARLDNEDSTYTVLLPTNKAWNDALDRIQKYFRFSNNTNNAQLTYSQSWIVRNLFFSKVKDPYQYDRIVSTNKDTFDVANLFMGATKFEASNGALFKTDTLRVAARESWLKPIVCEAEWTQYGRTNTNSNIFSRNSEGTGYETSGGKYITIDPTTTSDISKVAAIFTIPDVLAATYDLYCVFVPERIVDTIAPKPNVANFFIAYRKENEKNNYTGTSFTALASKVETSADTISKVYMGRVTFPWCSLAEGPNPLDVKVRVENAVTRAQTTTKSRTMRIDSIIFEPVE